MGRVVRAQQTYKAATGATVADLPQILTALLAADNDVRGSAEATLRNVARDANVVPALLTHARMSMHAQQRLSRPRITSHARPPSRSLSSLSLSLSLFGLCFDLMI